MDWELLENAELSSNKYFNQIFCNIFLPEVALLITIYIVDMSSQQPIPVARTIIPTSRYFLVTLFANVSDASNSPDGSKTTMMFDATCK